MRCTPQFTLVLALLTACSGEPNPDWDLSVRGEAFGAGDVHVALTRLDVDALIGCESARVAGGTFDVDFGPIMAPNVEHRVDTFVDLDGNNRCEFGVDAVMSLQLSPASAAATVRFVDGGSHVGDDPTGCGSFGGVGFRVRISGVAKTFVRYALVRLDAAGKLITTGAVVATGGMAVIDLPGAGEPGRAYRIDFFEADTSGATCGSTTHVYRVSPDAVGTDGPFACASRGEPVASQVDLTSPATAAGDCNSFWL